jgi:hypothetical protein
VALCRPRLAPRLASANERKERRYGGLGSSRDLVRAQRDKLAELYRDGEIGDDTRRVIFRLLDLQEPRSFGWRVVGVRIRSG